MRIHIFAAAAVASVALLASLGSAGAAIGNNAISHNALTNNALTSNALTSNALAPAGSQLGELNGVAVFDVTLPARAQVGTEPRDSKEIPVEVARKSGGQ